VRTKKIMVMAIAVVILFSPLTLKLCDLQNTKPQTPTVAKSVPVKVACVGDSITQDSEYPSVLQTLLGENYSVGNFGSRGSTVTLNSWKPYMNQSEFQAAQDFEPDIIVIMLGTNDDLSGARVYNASFEDDYTTLITSFLQLDSNPQVLIAKSPPIFNDSSDLSPTYLSNTIIPKTENVANHLNLPIIDVYDAFGNDSTYFVDGVHPNSQGAELIASEVYGAISDAQNTPDS
jgi:acyl-CoA thioesterase I